MAAGEKLHGSNLKLAGYLKLLDNPIYLGLADNAYITTSVSSSSLDITNLSGDIDINATNVYLNTGLISSPGLFKYQGQYWGLYDNRTLVDKEYVDFNLSLVGISYWDLNTAGELVLNLGVPGPVMPHTDAIVDFGSSSFRWNDYYVNGDINLSANSLIQTNTGTGTLSLSDSGNSNEIRLGIDTGSDDTQLLLNENEFYLTRASDDSKSWVYGGSTYNRIGFGNDAFHTIDIDGLHGEHGDSGYESFYTFTATDGNATVSLAGTYSDISGSTITQDSSAIRLSTGVSSTYSDIVMYPNGILLGSIIDGEGSSGYQIELLDNGSSGKYSLGVDKRATFIGTKASLMNPYIYNSVIIGGTGLTGSVSNTVYLGNNVNINNEYTLPNVDGTSGQVLKTNGSGVVTWQADTSGVNNLADLNDVNFITGTPNTGDILVYNGTEWEAKELPVSFNVSAASNAASNTDRYLNTDQLGLNTTPYILPEDAKLTHLSAACSVAGTWTAEVHVNGAPVGATVTVTAATKAFIKFPTPLSFNAGDEVSLFLNGIAINRPRINAIFTSTP